MFPVVYFTIILFYLVEKFFSLIIEASFLNKFMLFLFHFWYLFLRTSFYNFWFLFPGYYIVAHFLKFLNIFLKFILFTELYQFYQVLYFCFYGLKFISVLWAELMHWRALLRVEWSMNWSLLGVYQMSVSWCIYSWAVQITQRGIF